MQAAAGLTRSRIFSSPSYHYDYSGELASSSAAAPAARSGFSGSEPDSAMAAPGADPSLSRCRPSNRDSSGSVWQPGPGTVTG